MGRLRKQICSFVLEYFDQTYSKELGDQWYTVRRLLLEPSLWQFAVLLNRFQCTADTEKHLLNEGYQLFSSNNFFSYRENLKCYINRKPGKYPAQRHETGKIKGHYILNAASLLPVLALDVKDQERVLDMCAAPGGKSIAILQCASLGHLHCNEPDIPRAEWLRKTLESFVPLSHKNILSISQLDGRLIGKLSAKSYDKVLVDAPCSNDRSWLFSSHTDTAKSRIMERKTLPLIQTELLRLSGASFTFACVGILVNKRTNSATLAQYRAGKFKELRTCQQQHIHLIRKRRVHFLHECKVCHQYAETGGTLIYSTCTLSKAENSDVISNILNTCNDVILVDLSPMARALSHEFTFASNIPYGLLVVPDKDKSWGPMFVSKLIKL